MTWARIKATGRGRIRLRLSIEGFPYEFVSHPGMVSTAADGRQRVCGLSLGGKISQKADPVRATIEASGLSFKIADIGGKATLAFAKKPTYATWLNGNTAIAASTLTVKSTTNWPTSGYFYIDSEACSYTGLGVGGTTFTGVTRGIWDTLDQAHYVGAGEFQRYPEITDLPTVLEGKRVKLFVYGQGDSATGDGTQLWLGVVSSEPRMSGPSWSLSCDSIARILDGDVGGDLGGTVTPRGIYFNGAPGGRWELGISRRATDGAMYSPPTEVASVVIPDATTTSGFFETAEDFYVAVNARLATICATWDAKLFIEPWGSSYRFRCEQAVAAVDAINMALTAPACEPYFGGGLRWRDEPGGDSGGAALVTMVQDTVYYAYPDATGSAPGAGGIPRGAFNDAGASTALSDDTVAALEANPPTRIYLGGAVGVPSSTTMAQIDWQDGFSTGSPMYVDSIDTATRSIVMAWSSRRGYRGVPVTQRTYTPESLPVIRFGREYGSATLSNHGAYDLMAYLTANAPADVNMGSVPMVRSGDWVSDATDPHDVGSWYAAFYGASSLARNRGYVSLSSVTLKDLITPDVQLAGSMLSFDTSGALALRRVRLASNTETATFAVTRLNLITDNGPPTYERAAIGMFNTLVLNEGYDPIEDENNGPQFKVRNVASYGRNPATRAVIIEPKSVYRGALPVGPDEVMTLAQSVLGTFSSPYSYVTCEVPLTAIDVTLGSSVSLTTKQLPDTNGTRGVVETVGILVGREIDLYESRITMTILLSTERIGGYAPSAKVVAQDNTSGNTWDIQLDSSYFATGDSPENHFLAGDRFSVYRFDSLTAGVVTGTVISATGDVVEVTLDGVWNPTATADQEWVGAHAKTFGSLDTENQALYCIEADSLMMVNFDPLGSVPAFVWSP